ncbi:MAG TPA: DMT family transporter [Patescibacteria group bacterium]|nr:DMT family transporter [Patescibacteria group bacterium]
MSSNLKALLAIVGAAVVGGGIPVFSKIGIAQIPPFTFAFLRFLIAGLILFPLVKNQLPQKLKIWRQLILISLPATINISLFVLGIRLTSATAAQLIYVIVPIITAIVAFWLIKESLGVKKLLGIILGLAGVLVVILEPLGNVTLLGNLLVLAAASAYAFYPVFSKKMLVKHSPLLLTFIFALTTAAVNLLLAGTELWRYPNWWQTIDLMAIMSVFYVGIFGGAIFYLLSQIATKHSSATGGTMLLYLQPIAAYFWASNFLGEGLSLKLILGGGLAVLGAYLVSLH